MFDPATRQVLEQQFGSDNVLSSPSQITSYNHNEKQYLQQPNGGGSFVVVNEDKFDGRPPPPSYHDVNQNLQRVVYSNHQSPSLPGTQHVQRSTHIQSGTSPMYHQHNADMSLLQVPNERSPFNQTSSSTTRVISRNVSTDPSDGRISPRRTMHHSPNNGSTQHSSRQVVTQHSPHRGSAEHSSRQVVRQHSPHRGSAEHSSRQVVRQHSPHRESAEHSSRQVVTQHSPHRGSAEHSSRQVVRQHSPHRESVQRSSRQVVRQLSPHRGSEQHSSRQVVRQHSPHRGRSQQTSSEIVTQHAPNHGGHQQMSHEIITQQSPNHGGSRQTSHEIVTQQLPNHGRSQQTSSESFSQNSPHHGGSQQTSREIFTQHSPDIYSRQAHNSHQTSSMSPRQPINIDIADQHSSGGKHMHAQQLDSLASPDVSRVMLEDSMLHSPGGVSDMSWASVPEEFQGPFPEGKRPIDIRVQSPSASESSYDNNNHHHQQHPQGHKVREVKTEYDQPQSEGKIPKSGKFLTKVQRELEEQRGKWKGDVDRLTGGMVGLEVEGSHKGVAQGTSSYVDTSSGKPVFKAAVDVAGFSPNDITVTVDKLTNKVIVQAIKLDHTGFPLRTFTQRVQLPRFADDQHMRTKLSKGGKLKLDVPLIYYFDNSKPEGRKAKSFVYQVKKGPNGDEQMEILVNTGSGFRARDLKVQVHDDNKLVIIGEKQGDKGPTNKLIKQYTLPALADVDGISSKLGKDGRLQVNVPLHRQK